MEPGVVETWDFLLFNMDDGITQSLPLCGPFLSQSWQKLHNSVAFTFFFCPVWLKCINTYRNYESRAAKLHRARLPQRR